MSAMNIEEPKSFGQIRRHADYAERGYARNPARPAAWKKSHAGAIKLAKDQTSKPGAGLNALDGMKTSALVVPAAGGKRSTKIQKFLDEAVGTGGVPKILGKGSYGTAIEITVTPDIAAALAAKGGLASIGLANAVEARGSTKKLRTGAKIVLKLANDIGPRVAQAIKELRVHAYLADPTVKTPGMPNSADYVPAYYGGGTIPGTSATVTFMGLVEGKTLSKTKEISVKQASRIERAYVSLWARGIYHADAHDGNLMFDSKGNPRIIDFGFAVVLPPQLVPKSYSEALSVEWAYGVDEFVQATLMNYTHHNPNTLALKMMRTKLPPGKLDALRRRRAKFIRERGGAAKRTAGSPNSGGAKPAKRTRVIDWGSVSTAKKPPVVTRMNIDWGSASSVKKPGASQKRAASKSPSGGGAKKKARVEVPNIVRTVAVKNPATAPPTSKPAKKPPGPPRPIGARDIRDVSTPQLKKLKVTNLKATLGGLRKAGYDIPAYSKLKKEGLVGIVRNARAKEPLASSRKTVKQLRTIAKGLHIQNVSKMKRANVVAAIISKRAR